MKAIVLAGGYAKRLWPITKHVSKPLLLVGKEPVINYVIRKLETVDVDKIYISTNEKFKDDYKKWLKKYGFKKIKIVIEKTHSEKEKLGAIGGINFLIKKENLKDDCIIVGGDNLLSFSMEEFIEFYKNKKAPTVAVFDVKSMEKAKLYGIVKTNQKNKIIDFLEKPENPPTTLASTCCYLFPKNILPLFSKYLNQKNPKDAPGFFLKWLCKKRNVFAFVFEDHWFDIGDKKTLAEARAYASK
ncbi:MAG: nucleotidyltransferase family protein [Candidatus Aenigmatarchaeota archaeon]